MFEGNSTESFQISSNYKFRHSYRQKANIEIKIFRHSFPYVVRRSRNIGADGIFVSTDQLDITKNTYLEVEFELIKDGRCSIFRLPVYVGRITDKGIDLLFVDHLNGNLILNNRINAA